MATKEQAHLTIEELLEEAEVVKMRIASLQAPAPTSAASPTSAHKNWCALDLSKPVVKPSSDINNIIVAAGIDPSTGADLKRTNSGQKSTAQVAGGVAAGGVGSPKAGASEAVPAAGGDGRKKGQSESGTDDLNEFEKRIAEEMFEGVPDVNWSDIKGLDLAMKTVQETVILPSLRPDVFRGLLAPTKGILFYGPPGTGKTLLAKAVAKESGYSFFNISASTLTSKWVGEAEKTLKALFSIAGKRQPSLLFFDEIDAILSARSENEADHSRRLKTEFMIQTDGAATSAEDRVLILGATNRPWDLDDAVMRRMPKKIYIPLPSSDARSAMITYHMDKIGVSLGGAALARIVKACDGYSGSDIKALCKEAAMGPIRRVPPEKLRTIAAVDLKAVQEKDFTDATKIIRPTSGHASLKEYANWTKQFGAS